MYLYIYAYIKILQCIQTITIICIISFKSLSSVSYQYIKETNICCIEECEVIWTDLIHVQKHQSAGGTYAVTLSIACGVAAKCKTSKCRRRT